MDLAHGLLLGFTVATKLINILYVLIGAIIGTLVGILPGLGSTATIAILIPVALQMDPAGALILLVGMCCGARYGGAVTAILMNLPGESSAVVTCLDGYQLAKQGRGGPALGLAAFSSFAGGTVSVIALMLLSPVLANLAVGFGPPEYFGLTLLGLCMVTSLTGSSVVKGMIAAIFGLLISTVGSDVVSGALRLTFGYIELMDGVSFVTLAVGLFAIGEILVNLESQVKLTLVEVPKEISKLLPNKQDLLQCLGTWVRSTIIGFFIGVLPGAGATVASFVSYTTAKNFSRTPERFGKGAVEGVAASESADNAAFAGDLVPMFTLGIPGGASAAMLMVVLMMFGVRPGPMLLTEHPEIFWGVVASMYIGNIMLLIINLPLIPVIVQFLRIPYYVLYIIILVVSAIGVFTLNYSGFDLWVMAIFGMVGYLFKKLDYPAASLLLAVILGPLVEQSLRQSLVMSRGSLAIFIHRPVCAVFLVLSVLALFAPWLQQMWIRRSRRREQIPQNQRTTP